MALLPRNPVRRPDGRDAVFADRARLRADLQGLGRVQLRPGRDGAVRGAGDGPLLAVDPRLDRPREQVAGQRAGVHRRRRGDGRPGLAGRAPGARQAGQPGRRHPADGDARHLVLPRRLRPDGVRQRHLQDRRRHAQGSGVRPRERVPGRHADQQGRPVRGGGRGGAGGAALAVLPEDGHRPGAARRRRRSPGGAVDRHSAQAHLGHRLERRRLRRRRRRHHLGLQAGRAVLDLAGGAEGAAGGHPRRPDLGARRDHRRADHRRRREALGGLHRADVRRRHRDLVRLRPRPRLSPVPARRVCSARRSSIGSEREGAACSTAKTASSRPATGPTAGLPDPAGPDRDRPAAGGGVRGRAAARVRVPAARRPDPVPDPLAGRARASTSWSATAARSRSAPAHSWRSAPTPPTTSTSASTACR